MKSFKVAILLVLNAVLLSGCVSGWMTQSTGKPDKFKFTRDTSREEVIATLGQPKKKITTINRTPRCLFIGATTSSITYAEIFEYRGKINAVDEGGLEITLSALTLGISELIYIPLTAVNIVKRSFEKHTVIVYFDNKDRVVSLIVDPPADYL